MYITLYVSLYICPQQLSLWYSIGNSDDPFIHLCCSFQITWISLSRSLKFNGLGYSSKRRNLISPPSSFQVKRYILFSSNDGGKIRIGCVIKDFIWCFSACHVFSESWLYLWELLHNVFNFGSLRVFNVLTCNEAVELHISQSVFSPSYDLLKDLSIRNGIFQLW